jgi:uncharacterized protein YqgC (DUF456 family)
MLINNASTIAELEAKANIGVLVGYYVGAYVGILVGILVGYLVGETVDFCVYCAEHKCDKLR